MPIRLTILLLLAIFGVMYLAPDAPPRPARVATAPVADPIPTAPDPAPSEPAAPLAAPTPMQPDPSPPVPERAPAALPAGPSGDLARVGPPTGDDLPTVSATPPADDTGPLTLPGLGFGDQSDDTAAALSMSDGARARAAQAASDALAGAPDNPIVNSVSEAANDLLRGLVAGDSVAPEPTNPAPVTVITPPQPTDPTPPPAGQIARVTGSAVNLRAGPSTANAVVGQVTFGQTLRVMTDTPDGWSEIEVPATGERAYIASQFLERLP